MSGGPYGRGKAPERACLRIEAWPAADRQLWVAACTPGDLLDDEMGARADRRAITNRKAEKGYGRWLTHLALQAPDCLSMSPADRITPDRVKVYVEHLQSLGNATRTVLARLQELGEVAKVMDPTRSWQFINAIASRIRARNVPARSKNHLRLSNELVDLGFALMDGAAAKTGWRRAAQYRDGLLIALLALVPLRRRNIASLWLGRTLVQSTSGWTITLEADDTKTHAPIEFDLPDLLVEPLHRYLQDHRPVLVQRTGRWHRDAGDALWVSKDGSPMTEMAIYDVIRARTKAAYGTAMNPHLFRDAAATTIAISSPEHVRTSAPLLGHRTFTTTERHYIQAKGLDAHRQFIAAVHPRRKP